MRDKKSYRIFVGTTLIGKRRTARDIAGAIVGDRFRVIGRKFGGRSAELETKTESVIVRWVKKKFDEKHDWTKKRVTKMQEKKCFTNVRFVKAA